MLNNQKLSHTLPPIDRHRSESSHNSPLSRYSPVHRKLQNMIATHDISVFLDNKRQVQKPQESSKAQELRQISLQLSVLRKKHDYSKILNQEQEQRMRLFNKQIRGCEEIEIKTIQKLESLKEEVRKVQEMLAEKKKQQLQAAATQKSYLHIIERMQTDQLRFQKKAQAFNKKLKAQSVVLNEQLRKKRKKREDLHHTREAFSSLELYVEKQIQDRKKELEELEKEASQKLELTVKRDQRDRRQLQIAEAAANQHRNRSAMEKREGLMIHRMWFNYQKFKHIHLLKNFSSIEQAFKQAMPGGEIQSITDMVSKLLTRENQYAELLEFVVEAKKKAQFYEENNRDLERKLKEIQHLKSGNSEFYEVRGEIMDSVVRNSELKEKQRGLRALNEKLNNWTGKLIQKLRSLSDQSIELPQSFMEKIRFIKNYIKKLLPDVKLGKQKEFRLDLLIEEIPKDIRKAMMFVNEENQQSDFEDYELTSKKLVTIDTPVPVLKNNH